MDTASLDNYQALNEQLAALVEAGVPLDITLGPAHQSAAQALARIDSTIVRRVHRGESLSDALDDDDQDVPASYRSLIQLGILTGNPAAALDGSNRVAASVDSTRDAWRAAITYPVIVIILAYFGLIGLCLYFVPTLQNMYESLRIPPGAGLHVLETLRDTRAIWIPVLPILLVVFVAWRIRAARRRREAGVVGGGLAGWWPGVSKTLFQERCARFAESLADLLASGVALDQALRDAADGCGDARLRAGARSLADEVQAGQFPNDDSAAARQFPPFLRWAIWRSEAVTGRERALRIAARTYRETADRRTQKLRVVAPVVALVLLGGTVTLLYGLALFVPVVELLRALAA